MTTSGGTAKDKPGTGTPRSRSRRPVDAKTKARILKAAREASESVPQRSRNEVAKQFGIAGSTLTAWCKAADPPITWDRAATAAAVQAVVADAKVRRQQIAEGLLDDVVKIRSMLFEPQTRVHYSVTLGRQEYQTQPSPGELRDLLVAAGIGLDKHIVLSRFDSDDRDLPAVDAWLEHMMGPEDETP